MSDGWAGRDVCARVRKTEIRGWEFLRRDSESAANDMEELSAEGGLLKMRTRVGGG